MNKTATAHISLFMVAAMLLMQACSWLDVHSHTDVDEEEMFATDNGFYTTLTGIYLEMGSQKLYGGNLPLYALEPLTQQFTLTGDDKDRPAWSQFSYETKGGQDLIDAIWLNAYHAIVNDNLLIQRLQSTASLPFDTLTAHILTGEALALRAYLYTDLLRMFSPSPSIDSQSTLVPWKTDFGFVPGKRIPAAGLWQKLIDDLLLARTYLQNDPIVKNDRTTNRYLQYNRQRRMNYYAVNALLARIFLYRGNYEKAYEHANEVISANRFSLIDPQNVVQTDTYGNEIFVDLLFSQEQIFALHTENILQTSRTYYESLLQDFVKSIDHYGEADPRQHWFFKNPSANNRINLVKYQRSQSQNDAQKYPDAFVPMLKLGEMYLIAAEAAWHIHPTTAVALQHLNTLRTARKETALPESTNRAQFDSALTEEYQREFCGEGQLFYYYKRRNMASIDDGFHTGNTITLQPGNYTFPLPHNEKQFGYAQ